MASKKTKEIWEFGDFQTPCELAHLATRIVKKLGFKPLSIVEPTCGRGAFLLSALDIFHDAESFVGIDINDFHLDCLQEQIIKKYPNAPVKIFNADFFSLDWVKFLKNLPEPFLIIGNPPWVTSSELGMLQSSNVPEKSNFQARNGLEALTGKSNFDISEWMLIKQLEWLKNQNGQIAILCKTAVARKVLNYAWKHDYPLRTARFYKIDAMKYFGASVDACFFLMDCAEANGSFSKKCDIYETLTDSEPSYAIGYHDGSVVSDEELYLKSKFLQGSDKNYIWRSGVKHDCAKVMELTRSPDGFLNGFGELIHLEEKYVFPFFKSSDIANGHVNNCRKYVLVTQQSIGEDTAHIKIDAPKTWNYLEQNSTLLGKRASSIYRDRAPFSIFGVGDYTFTPWKVAISGFYKNLDFKVIGFIENKPAIFDDTIYFLSAWSEGEANFLAEILNSKPANEFLTSMVFWSNKRPITIDLLKRLNLSALARKLGRENEYQSYIARRLVPPALENQPQQVLPFSI